MQYTSHNEAETKEIATTIARSLKAGDRVWLEGDLGAGKTTLVQGILEVLGVTEPVRSPTFSLVNTYTLPTPTASGIERVAHMDFYRLEDPREARMLGLEDLFEDKCLVSFIEWPQNGFERIEENLYTVHIKIETLDKTTREISIS